MRRAGQDRTSNPTRSRKIRGGMIIFTFAPANITRVPTTSPRPAPTNGQVPMTTLPTGRRSNDGHVRTTIYSLLAIAIIAFAAYVLPVNSTGHGRSGTAQAVTQVSTLKVALSAFELSCRHYPTELVELV